MAVLQMEQIPVQMRDRLQETLQATLAGNTAATSNGNNGQSQTSNAVKLVTTL